MKIIFGLGWSEGKLKSVTKLFKDAHAGALFEKYRERIQHDFVCEVLPLSFGELKKQTGILWICERAQKSRALTSEALSEQFQKACDSGVKTLTVWIGSPDGVSMDQLLEIHPHLIWSFGPLTLPHELAAVVAAEQLYRAISILKNHPYHAGH